MSAKHAQTVVFSLARAAVDAFLEQPKKIPQVRGLAEYPENHRFGLVKLASVTTASLSIGALIAVGVHAFTEYKGYLKNDDDDDDDDDDLLG